MDKFTNYAEQQAIDSAAHLAATVTRALGNGDTARAVAASWDLGQALCARPRLAIVRDLDNAEERRRRACAAGLHPDEAITVRGGREFCRYCERRIG